MVESMTKISHQTNITPSQNIPYQRHAVAKHIKASLRFKAHTNTPIVRVTTQGVI